MARFSTLSRAETEVCAYNLSSGFPIAVNPCCNAAPDVEKTAAVKKTPRQAASSIESSGRLSFDIPVDTGMYQ